MEILGKNTVVPAPGEIMEYENITLERFGKHGKQILRFGTPARTDNPDEICFSFVATNTETFVAFNADTSNTSVMAGPREIVVALHPGALAAEPGVLAWKEYPRGGNLEGFVSADGVDPLGTDRWVLGFIPETGKLGPVKAPPRVSFPPHQEIFVTLRRTKGTHSGRHPLAMMVIATDDPDHGGEVAIVKAADLPNGHAQGVFMQVGNVKGIFLPEDNG